MMIRMSQVVETGEPVLITEAWQAASVGSPSESSQPLGGTDPD
jgi:hypothetical protein